MSGLPDVRGFCAALDITLIGGSGENAGMRCPYPGAHKNGDRHPSASIHLGDGRWMCHVCQDGGRAFELARARGWGSPDARELADRFGLWEEAPDSGNGNGRFRPPPVKPAKHPPRPMEVAPLSELELDVDDPAPVERAVRFTPSDRLLANVPPDPEFVWSGALVARSVTMPAGKPKAGKSTLLFALAKAVAERQGSFLGRALRGGPVVYASEESRATLGSTFPRHPDIHLLTREDAWPKPTWSALIGAAVDAARQVGAVLVIIDTFSFFNGLGRDEEKDAAAGRLVEEFGAELARTDAAGVLNHHHRKQGGEDGDALRGATAITAAVDCFCEIERIPDAPANHRRLVVTSRWTQPPVLVFEWDREAGYRVLGEAEDRDGTSEVGWRERLLGAIPADIVGVATEDLEKVLGDKRKWFPTLTKLMDERRADRYGEGKKGSPFRYFLLQSLTAEDSVPEFCPEAGTETDRNAPEAMLSDSVRPRRGTESESNGNSNRIPSRTDGKDGIHKVSDAAVVREGVRLRLVEDDGEHADLPSKKPPSKPQRAADLIREMLPADGEWHSATPIREKLAEAELDNPTSLSGAKSALLEQGLILDRTGRLPKQSGDRTLWSLTPTQVPLEPSAQPDEKPPATKGLVAQAMRRYGGKS